MTEQTTDRRIFSGVQPTGALTLGNYLGAIKRFVALQDEAECIYCAVDMHAITVPQSPKALMAQTRSLTAAFLASGIDPERSIVFNQSRVAAHAELAWVFECVARMGWMERMTQFKDKSRGQNSEAISLGLFAYPALMAADILVYRATHVPVGDDQKQHLELTRDIAGKFNNDYADRIRELRLPEDYMPIIEPVIGGPAARVMSLKDGSKKMSKSDPADNSRINLTDDADTIARKFKKATTDPNALPSEPDGLKDRAEAANLVGIYAALADTDVDSVLAEFGGEGFGKFKPALAELAVEKLAPITSEMNRLEKDPRFIDDVLAKGADKARALADATMRDVRKIVGFLA